MTTWKQHVEAKYQGKRIKILNIQSDAGVFVKEGDEGFVEAVGGRANLIVHLADGRFAKISVSCDSFEVIG